MLPESEHRGFTAAGIKFLFLSQIGDLFPKGKRPHRETLLRAIRSGKLRGRRLGREFIVTEASLADYLTHPE